MKRACYGRSLQCWTGIGRNICGARLRRIEGAARQVCGDRWNYSQFRTHAASKCRHDTVAAAVAGLCIDTLTQAWNGQQAPSAQIASR